MPKCIRCGESFIVKNDDNLLSKSLCPKCIEFEYANNMIICNLCGEAFEPEETMDGICFDCRTMNCIDERDDILHIPYEEDSLEEEENL
ncbi:hypothetical protein [Sedimentibacter sp. B4]|uniref:hypothetical protein n=1 Tax=Sedimentibacter sp. B4 TaxID=304766 RepID=UPI000316F001|nr:hypothetical protein [Sedimentibacter sp. B4]